MGLSLARPALLRSLGTRPFAFLWTGQTVSRVGDSLYEIALAWWVLQHTGSPAAMGTVLICAFAPMLLFLLLGGVAVDRLPRGRVMLASDLSRGAVVLGVAGLAASNHLVIGEVYGASLIFGFVDAFFQPAYIATVPDIVPAKDLPSANSLTSLSAQTGRIAGPALGAVIVGAGGTTLAFALDGLSFLISSGCLFPLVGIGRSSAGGGGSNVVRDVREALGAVLARPFVWISIAVSALCNMTLAGPYSVALPFLVKDHLHAGVGTLGLLYAAFPVGYLLSSIWLGSMARIHHRGILAYLGIGLAGLGLLMLGLPVPLAVMVLAALVNGAALEAFGQVWTNTLQELVPGEQLGRVASIDLLGSYVLLPVGYGLTGWLTGQMGAAPVFILGGGITAALATLALSQPVIRHLD
jgi:DHA3 family tetracycline resistance protein-like MFS transporter